MEAFGRVLDSIDRDRLVQQTLELIRFPSINPPGDYTAVAGWVRAELSALGLEPEDVCGEAGRPNIVVRIPGTGGGHNLCLSSHMDVVSPGDRARWKHDPFEGVLRDGVIHGRGVADSKGMLAAMLEAVRAILTCGVKLRGDLYFVAAVDDETAGRYGLRYAFETGKVDSPYVILGEATGFGICHLFKGRIWIRLEVLGTASHSAYPERGVNAIAKAAKILHALYDTDFGAHPILGPSTCNVGLIEGGQQLNVLPESCRFTVDIRWGPPLTSRDIRQRVEAAIEKVRRADPEVRVAEWQVTEERDPLVFPEDSALISAIRDAGQRVFERPLPSAGWYSSGEVFHINRLGGLAAGVLLGPGVGWAAHAPNESLDVADLVDGARLYALTALGVCGLA